MEGYVEIEKYKALEAQVESLKYQLDQMKRMIFGAKSERYIAEVTEEQLSLFDVPSASLSQEEKVRVPAHDRKKTKKHPVRLVLPEHLKREETVIEPKGVDLANMVRIGEERTETLHYTPAELIVKVIVRPKYAPKTTGSEAEEKNDGPILIAPLPSRFIEKCIADESLLRLILTDKYLDHLPLYRISARFERLGMLIPRSTMCGWVEQSADRISVLHDKLIKLVLAADYLQVDETRMEVLPDQSKRPARGSPGKKKKRKTHRGFLWGYHAVHEKLIFFDYSPTREAENPVGHLKHFTGVLQTDCYDVYDQIRKLYRELIHYHCLNHARREFEKALGNDAQGAGYALEQFQVLYAVEREAREDKLDAEAIYALRQEKSRPVLEALFDWMDNEWPNLPPSSPIAKAMGYMIRRKKRMMYYLQDGRLLIDTNPIENLIRPIAVGRRNYLFAGSHEGAQRAAIFYSLFACCKLNQVDPVQWLENVMIRLPEHPVNRIEELLPHRWKKDNNTEEENL